MANKLPCGQCAHYDPILRGTRETHRGTCVKRSVYPEVRDHLALPLPPGAKTAEVAKLDVRLKGEVVTHCLTAAPQTAPRNKGERLLQLIRNTVFK